MAKRGRRSMAELAVTQVSLEAVPRPDSPYDLTDEESTEWWAIVARMPADWFPRETHALLTNYCRHVVTARRVAQLIQVAERAEHIDLDQYDQLLRMRERETRAASSLATRMRITQQSSYDPTRKKPATPFPPPWADRS
jgi:hypothetical protein